MGGCIHFGVYVHAHMFRRYDLSFFFLRRVFRLALVGVLIFLGILLLFLGFKRVVDDALEMGERGLNAGYQIVGMAI